MEHILVVLNCMQVVRNGPCIDLEENYNIIIELVQINKSKLNLSFR